MLCECCIEHFMRLYELMNICLCVFELCVVNTQVWGQYQSNAMTYRDAIDVRAHVALRVSAGRGECMSVHARTHTLCMHA